MKRKLFTYSQFVLFLEIAFLPEYQQYQEAAADEETGGEAFESEA